MQNVHKKEMNVHVEDGRGWWWCPKNCSWQINSQTQVKQTKIKFLCSTALMGYNCVQLINKKQISQQTKVIGLFIFLSDFPWSPLTDCPRHPIIYFLNPGNAPAPHSQNWCGLWVIKREASAAFDGSLRSFLPLYAGLNDTHLLAFVMWWSFISFLLLLSLPESTKPKWLQCQDTLLFLLWCFK